MEQAVLALRVDARWSQHWTGAIGSDVLLSGGRCSCGEALLARLLLLEGPAPSTQLIHPSVYAQTA